VCTQNGARSHRSELVQEQEQLIAAFQEENRAAAARVKTLEGQLRAKGAAMQEQRSALERQILQASAQHGETRAETAAKLRPAAELCVAVS